jgi:hypothetical protein
VNRRGEALDDERTIRDEDGRGGDGDQEERQAGLAEEGLAGALA